MTTPDPSLHIFGIRHHGPGSARSLLAALDQLQPDIILVEGPPDGEAILPFLTHDGMQPPVALLIYAPDDPQYAAYYPFALFSPEYQAIHYAAAHDIPVRFMDLPQAVWFEHLKTVRTAMERDADDMDVSETAPQTVPQPSDDQPADPDSLTLTERIRRDPLGELAKAAGYDDGERWWDQMIEQRIDSSGIFEAVLEAMIALREDMPDPVRESGEADEARATDDDSPEAINARLRQLHEQLREASMRRIIRRAQQDGYERIAIVCGAWHGPALMNPADSAADDDALLADLPRMSLDATWIPWTHSRLARFSGYGAGVTSPGWYHYLWTATGDIGIGWLTRVAHLLRERDLDASSAQVIDAVRLANTLAILRGRPMPGLEEFNEATLTVFCAGNTAPLQLIADRLIVGEIMGSVPDAIPVVPLQRDLQQQQDRLKLRVQAEASTLNLDLRNDLHLERSHLLHRLLILQVSWGNKQEVIGKTGTFHEVWEVQWQPEMTIQIIEKSSWGNTVHDAATAYALHIIEEKPGLPMLTALVRDVLLADLKTAIHPVTEQLENEAALTGDTQQLMASLPALVDVIIYGDVRGTDTTMVARVIKGMITRTCVGLPAAATALDDDAAAALLESIIVFNHALRVLQQDSYLESWFTVLAQVMDQTQTTHGLIRGRCCRILVDNNWLSSEDSVTQMRLALSPAADPADAGAWLMGFLRGSGLILLHDDHLLGILDEWVTELQNEDFEILLPLLRRTFATFTLPELRRIGKRIAGKAENETESVEIDEDRASAVLPVLAELLGMSFPDNT